MRFLLHFVSIMRRNAHAIGGIALLLFSGLTPIYGQTQSSQDTDLGKEGPGKGVYRVGGGVTPPRVVYGPDPEYSEEARLAHVSGTCILSVVVDPTGLPRDITVEKTLGRGLDEKAIAAVRTWRFAPGMKDGVPVTVQVNIEVTFRISYDLDTRHHRLLEKANAGNTKAQLEISQDFLAGRGVPLDENRGFAYLVMAAKQAFPPAEFEMGEFLASRRNDLVMAYVWYALAQRNHYKHCDQKMKELAERMTVEQLAEARRRAEAAIRSEE